MSSNFENMRLFSGTANNPLAQEIAAELDIELSDISLSKFSCGENYARVNDSIRGIDAYVVQSIGLNPNDDYMELFLILDALKRASTKRIHVVIPHFGYARQDKKSAPREPISSRLIADLLSAVGFDRLITVDLHSDQIQGFFNRPVDHLTCLPLFSDYFKQKNLDNLAVVAPDTGRAKFAKKLGDQLNADLVVLHKTRPKHNVAEITNVVVNEEGNVDFTDSSKTENTRVSYPIHHIDNIVKPKSKGNHATKVIFLTCDAYGVLPPVSKLNKQQAMYQYLSGYTAKVAGTELGITEPTSTFSTCFGSPFLTVHPTLYADILGNKIDAHNADAYLVNTGWTGGSYGIGSRISLKNTRAIIDAILDGSIENSEFETTRYFKLQIPKSLPNVSSQILNPSNAWEDKAAYQATATKLAKEFKSNFNKFIDTDSGKAVQEFGPEC